MAILMPILISIFIVVVQLLFYYHDKNVLTAAVYEVTVEGSSREYSKEELGLLLQEKINHRMILFTNIQADIVMNTSEIKLHCKSTKQGMVLQAEVIMYRKRPEGIIRNVLRMKKIEEEIGEL